MNPKESAQHLVEKFYNVEDTEWIVDNGCGITWNEAKQCALIAVDEIIEAIDWHEFEHPNKEFDYWQEVKEEIEKL
jgi:hypothetical protein